MQKEELKALIFNIQRFCIHDGPGIRTTVFFKGCNLHCWWCHNPESKDKKPEIMFYRDRCLLCTACVDNCPEKALRLEQGEIKHLQSKCKRCFKCAAACTSEAIIRSGREMAVEEVFNEVLKDEVFFETSGGGVTASGGEPLLFDEFIQELFTLLKERGVSTCIETAGNTKWDKFETLLPATDIFLYDIKSGDPEKLLQATGAALELVCQNIKRLLHTGKKIFIRVPLIPGFNTEPEELEKIVSILKKLPRNFLLEPLRYNCLGTSKYPALNINYNKKAVSEEEIETSYQTAKQLFLKAGLPLFKQ